MGDNGNLTISSYKQEMASKKRWKSGQQREIVTFMAKLPLSVNIWAMLVSKTRQSLLMIAGATPSNILRGVACQVNLRRLLLSSKLKEKIYFTIMNIHTRLLKTWGNILYKDKHCTFCI